MPATAAATGTRERKLPIQQLLILAICRFAEPIAATSIFPYLPEMVESFNVPKDEIGKWAGICSGAFSLFQAIMGIPWGRFSDLYGRKISILLALATSFFTILLWGFSTNLYMAIIARCISGAGNGNVGIIRTTVAEMVPFKELQPRAFSFMPLVWNLGSIFGPMIGGALANPYNVKPSEYVNRPNLLQRFPYALPNLVAAVFFLIGIITGILFLEETLETRKDQRDYGRILGRKLSAAVKKMMTKATDSLGLRDKPVTADLGERQPLLDSNDDEETLVRESKKPKLAPPSYRDVLNRQAVFNLIVYFFIAMHTMAYDQLLPVFLHHDSLRTRQASQRTSNPLSFSTGLGLNHFEIGAISTAYGICGMVGQFLLYAPVARRFGVLNCLKFCAIIFPIAYFITPFAALVPGKKGQMATIFAIMLFKGFASIFAFPSSTILLTNSANSMHTLGTLNGIATSVSAVGRGISPVIGGALFTAGVKAGYVIAPWWLFSALAIIAAVPVWWLVEGEGFDEDAEQDRNEADQALWQEAALEGEAEATGEPGPMFPPTASRMGDEDHTAHERENSCSQATIASDLSLGSALSANDSEDDFATITGSLTPTRSRN